jgi:hypothetical protein
MARQGVSGTGRRPVPVERRLVTIAGALLAAVTLTSAGGYLWWANHVPPLPPENVRLPSPNGFDACLAAAGRLPPAGKRSPFNDPAETDLHTLRGALAREKPTLDELRRALRLEYVNPPARSQERYSGTFIMHYPDAAQRFVAESRVALADGRPALALERALDAVELGSRIGTGGILDCSIKARICSSRGAVQAERCLERLSEAEARTAARRLDRLIPRFTSFADATRESRRFYLASRHEVYSGRAPVWLHARAPSQAAMVTSRVTMFLEPKPLRLAAWDAELREMVRYAELPWPQRQQQKTGVRHLGLRDSVEERGFAMAAGDAQLRLLRVELALREYRAARGRYPDTLAELVPSVLPRLPKDPFTEKPLFYRRQGERYLLCSPGPDGMDDGGRPVPAQSLHCIVSTWMSGPMGWGRDARGAYVSGDLTAGQLAGRQLR